MQHKTKPLFFTFQLKALKILQVNLFFPEPVTFLFLYFFAAFANYSKEYRLSSFLRTYLRLFYLFIPTKHHTVKLSLECFYFWLVEALEIEVIVCCPVTSVVFILLFCTYFFGVELQDGE